MKNMLGRAISIAAQVHENQTDMGGNAYILHPMRIMMRLRTKDEELMTIAILHDVVEDSSYMISTLIEEGFTKRVCDALQCLTHPVEESYEDYIKRVATNVDAIRVKLEDLRDNSDITRLKGLREKDMLRMAKYHKAYVYLSKILNANEEIYG